MKFGKLNKQKTAFILVDIQEKFVPAMHKIEDVINNSNILIKASETFRIPLIVTEQYPKGLGNTIKEIKLPENHTKDNEQSIDNITKIEKTHFSCFGCDEFSAKLDGLKKKGITSLVLFGIEAHVCILKTALDALEAGFNVHVVADAVTSRTPLNKDAALKRMDQSGVFIATTEMILFQLMEKAEGDEFKEVSRLIR